MKSLMHIVILSCKRATFYIEKSHAKRLSFIERVQLRMHLAICDKCAEYKKQSALIEAALKSHQRKVIPSMDLKLSDNFKRLIQSQINENLKKK